MRAQTKPNRSGDLQKAGETDDQYKARLRDMGQEHTVAQLKTIIKSLGYNL